MASINLESPPIVLELQKDSYASSKTTAKYVVVLDMVLRISLFATTLTSVLALVTGNQTEMIAVPFPPYKVSVTAKYTDSSAFM